MHVRRVLMRSLFKNIGSKSGLSRKEGKFMAIFVAFICGMCFLTLGDAIADYIGAHARMLEAKAHQLEFENEERRRKKTLQELEEMENEKEQEEVKQAEENS